MEDYVQAYNERYGNELKTYSKEWIDSYYSHYVLPDDMNDWNDSAVLSFLYNEFWDTGCYDYEWDVFDILDSLWVNDKICICESSATGKVYVFVE